MNKYVIRRLLLFVPTLFILSLIIFGIMRILPGDFAILMLSDEGGGVTSTAFAKTLEELRERLGLNEPLYAQYATWAWGILKGNLGTSLYSGQPMTSEIFLRFPLTLQLAVMAKVISLAIGIPVGILSAVYRNTWLDYVLRFWSIVFLAAPAFWLALIVILVGVLVFQWTPPVGYNSIWQKPWENLQQMLWPSLILASHGMASIARMTRSTMLEVLGEDYIRTARAKGLTERVLITRHALKNALIPVVTVAGISFGHMLGGAVILEYIFGIPGLGAYFIGAIQGRDYPVVQGTVVVFGLVFMVVNLVVDMLYGWLDPRISYS